MLTRAYVYQKVRNINFLENIAYVLIQWPSSVFLVKDHCQSSPYGNAEPVFSFLVQIPNKYCDSKFGLFMLRMYHEFLKNFFEPSYVLSSEKK